MTVAPALHAVLCTYRRPHVALAYLDHLERQTLAPDLVVVVDNGADPSLADAIRARNSERTTYEYLASPGNIGPAGAFKLGFDHFDGRAGPHDLLVHLDDDDPPVITTALSELVADLQHQTALDATVGGIGLSGGNLDRRTGLIKPPRPRGDVAVVDHLHGGYLPVYRIDALTAVKANDPTFWFGFEELELGRRLTLAGWRLLVDTRVMAECEGLYPKRASRPVLAPSNEWARFHKERNLLRILRREHAWSAIAFTVFARHLLRPLRSVLTDPSGTIRRVRLGWRITVSGLRGQTGIDARYPPP